MRTVAVRYAWSMVAMKALLTDIEQALVHHVADGTVPDLLHGEPANTFVASDWDDSNTVRAFVIRDIVRGVLVEKPDPRGIQLRGAHIIGRVDLDSVVSTVPITLLNCSLERGMDAVDGRLIYLGLHGCRLEHPSLPVLNADRLSVSSLHLREGTTIVAHNRQGAIRLAGAHISGQLDLSGAVVRSDKGPALHAEDAQVGGSVFFCDGFHATGATDDGTIRLAGARIGGQLNFNTAVMENSSGPALIVDQATIERGMFMREGFRASGTGSFGAVSMSAAHIKSQLDFQAPHYPMRAAQPYMPIA